MPLEPNEPVVDGDARRERVRDCEGLLDELIEAERLCDSVLLLDTLVVGEGTARTPERVALLDRLRDAVLLLDTLVVGEGTARLPEPVALLETLAERLTELLRDA